MVKRRLARACETACAVLDKLPYWPGLRWARCPNGPLVRLAIRLDPDAWQ